MSWNEMGEPGFMPGDLVVESSTVQSETDARMKHDDLRRKRLLNQLSKSARRKVTFKKISKPSPTSKWKIVIIPISFILLVLIVELLALFIVFRKKPPSKSADLDTNLDLISSVSVLPDIVKFPLPGPIPENCWRPFSRGEDYRGIVSTTISGKTCQRWDSQTPHQHERTPENFASFDLIENYCRNPDMEDYPWCFTTDVDARWERCAIPECTGKDCWDMNTRGVDYRGAVGETETGRPCQDWEVQYPHSHIRTPENFPGKGLKGAYCRNPDRSQRPWCYTTDSDKRWEYCDIKTCKVEFHNCNDACEYVLYRWVKNYQVGLADMGAPVVYAASDSRGPLNAYCDCSDGPGRAWMVILRKMQDSRNFSRALTDYVVGFGDNSGEYWMGLYVLSRLTNEGSYMLRIDLQNGNETTYGEYSFFSIGDAGITYQLNLGSYSGRAKDTLAQYDGRATVDGSQPEKKGIIWKDWEGWDQNVHVEMKIREID